MLEMTAAAITDKGVSRENNEDRVWAQVYSPSEGETIGLFIVCDGVGGHLGGECASHWAVETIKRKLADYFCPGDPRATVKLNDHDLNESSVDPGMTRRTELTQLISDVRSAIQEANQVVFNYARNKPSQAGDAGTTISMALIQGSKAVIANVGDSRTYLLRDQRLKQVTQDHSLVANLVAKGKITPEEVYTHPQRNVIYRSLGQKSEVEIDTFVESLKAGDSLLLCTDGLWEMVTSNEEIVEMITANSQPTEACHRLIEAANAAGGEDNIGIVVIKIAS